MSYAEYLRPATNGEGADPARIFTCTKCGADFMISNSCDGCGESFDSTFISKLIKVEEHLHSYVEQLADAIASASDLEIPSLRDTVCSDPAGVYLFSPNHYIRIRLTLCRAKFHLQNREPDLARENWQKYLKAAKPLHNRLII